MTRELEGRQELKDERTKTRVGLATTTEVGDV